eukprot:765767-Hanusia_phi.AAC.18
MEEEEGAISPLLSIRRTAVQISWRSCPELLATGFPLAQSFRSPLSSFSLQELEAARRWIAGTG